MRMKFALDLFLGLVIFYKRPICGAKSTKRHNYARFKARFKSTADLE